MDPRPEPLVFAEGIRFPRDDEFPKGFEEQRRRLASARITAGYRFSDQRGPGFRAYFEANVHAPDIWETFRQVALAILPEVAAPIVGVKEDEPLLGPYTDRNAALAVLEPHRRHLVHDGLLEFGMIHQHGGTTEEVFVRAAKYLHVWTNRPDAVRAVFASRGVPAVPDCSSWTSIRA